MRRPEELMDRKLEKLMAEPGVIASSQSLDWDDFCDAAGEEMRHLPRNMEVSLELKKLLSSIVYDEIFEDGEADPEKQREKMLKLLKSRLRFCRVEAVHDGELISGETVRHSFRGGMIKMIVELDRRAREAWANRQES